MKFGVHTPKDPGLPHAHFEKNPTLLSGFPVKNAKMAGKELSDFFPKWMGGESWSMCMIPPSYIEIPSVAKKLQRLYRRISTRRTAGEGSGEASQPSVRWPRSRLPACLFKPASPANVKIT